MELSLINIQLTGHAFGSGVAVWGELIPVLKFKGHAGRVHAVFVIRCSARGTGKRKLGVEIL